MSEASPVRGVVVGHAEMARGLVSAVRGIAGDVADALEPLSNQGKSPDVLRTELDELAGQDDVIVFVDLKSGSCGMAGLQCCKDRTRRILIGGVNLPMLLDFVFHRDLPLEELGDRLIEQGRSAIDRPLKGR